MEAEKLNKIKRNLLPGISDEGGNMIILRRLYKPRLESVEPCSPQSSFHHSQTTVPPLH